MKIEELTNQIKEINDQLISINTQYTEMLAKKEENEKKLESSDISPVDKEYARGFLEGINPRFEIVNYTRTDLLNKLEEKTAALELEKEKEKIANNTYEENQKYMEKISKEISMAEKNCKEISEEIEYYKTRLERETFEPQKRDQIVENIKILEEKYKREIGIIGDLKLKLNRIKEIVEKAYTNTKTEEQKFEPSISDDTKEAKPQAELPSPSDNKRPEMDTIPEGKRIMVVPQPTPQEPPKPIEPELPILVEEIEKKPNFFSKHKKAILIAAGLAVLSTVLVPPLAAAMMYGNSVLWGACANIPAIGGMAQAALHTANIVLSPLAGAAGTFSTAAGTWTLSSGTILNAGAASAGIAETITALIVNGTITTAAVAGFRKLTKKLKESFKKNKEKEIPTKQETPLPEGVKPTPDGPVPSNTPTMPTPIPSRESEQEKMNYYEMLGINPDNRTTVTKEEITSNLIKINSEIINSKDKNVKIKLQKLLEAYKVLTTPELKQAYDKSLGSIDFNESKGGMVR